MDDNENGTNEGEEITETDGTEAISQEPYDLNLSNFNLWVKAQKLDENEDATQVTVKDGDEIEITFNWSITNNVLDENGEKQLIYSYELDTPGITLNDLYNDDEDSNAVYSDDIRIGYYTIVENVFTIYLDSETTENKSDISGGAIIEGVVSLDADDTLYDDSEQILGVADKTYNVTYNSGSKKGTVDIQKSTVGEITETEEGFYTQEYQVVINITGKITNISMEDILPDGLNYVEDTLTADEGLTAEYKDGTINVTIPDSETKSGSYTYTITYTVMITSEAMLTGEDITNTAKIKYTDSDKIEQEETSTTTITPPTTGGTEEDPVVGYATVKKEAIDQIAYHTADDEDTESYYYQDYSITIEVVGKATDVSLSDELPETLTLIESTLNLEIVSSTTVDEGDVTLTFEDPYIKAIFPDGVEDETTTYTITYRAKVDTDVIKNLGDIKNTATLTYKDPDGNTSIKTSEVTVTPISISLNKTGSYVGTSSYSEYQYAFDWKVIIDFGTLGLSLTDDEINEILATITDITFINEDASLTITPSSPYGTSDSPYLNSNGYSDNAAKLFFFGSNITVDDLVNNEDGTYSLYYSVSYYMTQYGVWGIDVTEITNVFEFEVNNIFYSSQKTVTNYDTSISFDKSTSLDSNSSLYADTSDSFYNYDIATYESESEVTYDDESNYYYKEYTIEITTPSNRPVSNITVNCDLDSELNYIVESIDVEKNGTSLEKKNIVMQIIEIIVLFIQ